MLSRFLSAGLPKARDSFLTLPSRRNIRQWARIRHSRKPKRQKEAFKRDQSDFFKAEYAQSCSGKDKTMLCILIVYFLSNLGAGHQYLSHVTKTYEKFIYYKGKKIKLKDEEKGYVCYHGREFFSPILIE
jgi:hypothetical protein